MKIVFIGSGNVATHLAKALHETGNQIVQVYSRSLENARALAESVSAEFTDNIQKTSPSADMYIFSVKDDVLPELLSQMPPTTGVWVHTAGSVPMNILAPYTQNYGAMYPLQTFSKKRALDLSQTPFFIEGNSEKTNSLLEKTAKEISTNVRFLSSEKRRYVHLAAVFACNFSNHMYALASEIVEKENIPFDVLLPLINETSAKLSEMSPKEAQTGPAIRFDEKVMTKQLQLIKDNDTQEIYKTISKSIHKHTT